MTALAAWQRGEIAAKAALTLLSPVACDAADFSNLGALLRADGRMADAEAAHRHAIALDPTFAAAHYNLGNLLVVLDRIDEAETAYRAALVSNAAYAEAWNALGTVVQRLGRVADAVKAFRAAVGYAPRWVDAHTNLGVALLGLGEYEAAQQALLLALSINPHHAAALGNLGAVYLRAGAPVAAESACRQANALVPDEPRWLTNLSVALQMQARHTESEACCRSAMAMRPADSTGHGNLLFALNYRDEVAAEAIFAEYRRWNAQHAAALARSSSHDRDRGPSRRLRVGYVSPDFRQHAVALFVEPLLAAHDRGAVELFCYADIVVSDPTTERIRRLADHWRDTIGLDDADLATTIERDRIDVLVDLSGHSAGNRLLTFARKPAPVQVCYLLGHGYTSGLAAMDAFLADEWLAPPGSEPLFSERIIRLPRIPFAYMPPASMPPVAPLAASRNGCVTFGYFGRTERLNDRVIAVWARILNALPGSRLMLNNRPFQEPACRALFANRFAAHNVDPTRLDMIYTSPQPETWGAYANIDIALDPFPHNAGTTTIEALWQGVPVVSLATRPSVGRFGASILHAISADDWVVDDEDGYVACAVRLAGDLDALAHLRASLRERVTASPLRDPDDLAHHIERAYRALWQAWCEGDTARLHRLYTSDAQAARSEAERLIARDARHGEAHHVLALIDYREQRYANADQHMQLARAATPERAELPANHAAILRMLGRLDDAETAARAALSCAPENVAAHNNLGNILRDAARYDESAACYRHAVRLTPRFTDAWVNLAWVLALAGHAREAERAARQAIDCDAGNANAHNNLGLALMRQGRLAEAEAALRTALALRPDFALPHSNILFCLNYRPELSAEARFSEYRAWDRRHALPLLGDPQFDIDARQGHRLRVGYVSPDFRQHAVALFAEPLLAAHDRASVELFCYAEVPSPDAVTKRFQALADHWRSTVGMSDADLAETIRQDRIDILVDLAGHTAGNRLLVFARKPAPVQVSYLLGHGYTSGLSAIDGFLADAMLAPDGSEALFSERLVRLTRVPLAYRPPADMPPVSPSPLLTNGHITFGYFGRTVRLNDAVIEAWARILQAVPGARLMLNSAPFAEPAGCEQMAARFAGFGVGRERLDLVCTSPQTSTWAAYGAIDIALDPFPHNAGTTTIEALWQGVPVVSLVGQPTVGRFGAAILHAIGLDGWLTRTIDEYVAHAIAAAADRATLIKLREDLRPRFAASPLRDEAGLAREVEAAYRALWDAWRNGEALARLGHQLLRQGSAAQAEAALRQALARNTNNADAHETLAALLGQSGRLIEAETHHRASLHGLSDRHRVLNNLGIVLQAQGRAEEAESCLREALVLRPDYATAHSNLLFALDYRADLSPQQIFAEYRQWNRAHAAPLLPRQPSFRGGRNDRLRVGYVSADFRHHSAALFAEPLLAAHDHAVIELFCYADVAIPDETTERFQSLADHWRPITGLDDATAADLIRRDGIDVLVDMTGHTGGSRLLAFARKPAPVQIAYLLGHGYTSGLGAMDAFLADAMLVPTGAEALFSERVIRLTRLPLAYAPPGEMPEVGPLPALTNGRVSFGYFGRLERLNAAVVATWSRILASLPGSRLVLNSQPLREAAFRDVIAARFAAHGIGRDRLDLACTSPQSRTWAAYGGIDIALDPFPHNAGTTTIEALWLGVPVVSLACRPSVGRFGAMILHAIGADDWVVQDSDAYVARALSLASDRDALAALRSSLRQRVAASPLLDAPDLARALEAIYRSLWRERCAVRQAA